MCCKRFNSVLGLHLPDVNSIPSPRLFSSVQSLSRVQLFVTPWTIERQASLSITNCRSLLKLMSIESVMPSNHPILCSPLLLMPSIFPSTRVSANESALRTRWPNCWHFHFYRNQLRCINWKEKIVHYRQNDSLCTKSNGIYKRAITVN